MSVFSNWIINPNTNIVVSPTNNLEYTFSCNSQNTNYDTLMYSGRGFAPYLISSVQTNSIVEIRLLLTINFNSNSNQKIIGGIAALDSNYDKIFEVGVGTWNKPTTNPIIESFPTEFTENFSQNRFPVELQLIYQNNSFTYYNGEDTYTETTTVPLSYFAIFMRGYDNHSMTVNLLAYRGLNITTIPNTLPLTYLSFENVKTNATPIDEGNTTLQNCQYLCNITQNCGGFEYTNSSQTCKLIELTETEKQNDISIGPASTVPQTNVYVKFTMGDYVNFKWESNGNKVIYNVIKRANIDIKTLLVSSAFDSNEFLIITPSNTDIYGVFKYSIVNYEGTPKLCLQFEYKIPPDTFIYKFMILTGNFSFDANNSILLNDYNKNVFTLPENNGYSFTVTKDLFPNFNFSTTWYESKIGDIILGKNPITPGKNFVITSSQNITFNGVSIPNTLIEKQGPKLYIKSNNTVIARFFIISNDTIYLGWSDGTIISKDEERKFYTRNSNLIINEFLDDSSTQLDDINQYSEYEFVPLMINNKKIILALKLLNEADKNIKSYIDVGNLYLKLFFKDNNSIFFSMQTPTLSYNNVYTYRYYLYNKRFFIYIDKFGIVNIIYSNNNNSLYRFTLLSTNNYSLIGPFNPVIQDTYIGRTYYNQRTSNPTFIQIKFNDNNRTLNLTIGIDNYYYYEYEYFYNLTRVEETYYVYEISYKKTILDQPDHINNFKVPSNSILKFFQSENRFELSYNSLVISLNSD